MLAYPIKLTKDDNDTYLVTCPDFPEVTTFGDDRDDALDRALDAIEEAISARIANREVIPRPSKGKTLVFLPTQAVLSVLLYNTMLERGINKSQLARLLHWHRPQVDRLLDLRHGTRLDHIDAAFEAMGMKVDISLS